MRLYEVTSDRGAAEFCTTSDTHTIYIITSARGKDLLYEYKAKYDRIPSARWYQRNFRFSKNPSY